MLHKLEALQSAISKPCFLVTIKDSFCWSGTILECEPDVIKVHLHIFTPGCGFVTSSQPGKIVYIHISHVGFRTLRLIVGMDIVGCGIPSAPGDDDHWFFDERAIVIP